MNRFAVTALFLTGALSVAGCARPPAQVESDEPVVKGMELRGTEGNDQLEGDDGPDIILGEGGDDLLAGGGGDDRIAGGAGNDILNGGGGDDSLNAGSGDDIINGGMGADDSHAGTGNDHITGGAGDDRLNGGEGDDIIDGGDDVDILKGQGGNDVMIGGMGADTMLGGEGADRYFFEIADLDGEVDTVLDFRPEEGDVIDVSDLLIAAHYQGDGSAASLKGYVRIVGSVIEVRGPDAELRWIPLIDVKQPYTVEELLAKGGLDVLPGHYVGD